MPPTASSAGTPTGRRLCVAVAWREDLKRGNPTLAAGATTSVEL
jgi:hypothetical protein